MLVSFEEMMLDCKAERGKEQIREAIKCYESGAYRAAIVMAHMAVCFDLLEKLKVLSLGGDAEATRQISIFQNHQEQWNNGNQQAISNLLTFERSLLETFRDHFEFFGANEYDDLARLRDDRNRCAHPTFFRSELPYDPTAELARLHIRNALSFVLTQEPRQGKAAIDELTNAVLSKYFPADVADATDRLRALGVGKARDSLIRAFVDTLIFKAADKTHPLYKKASAYVALDGVIELRRDIAAPRAAEDVKKLHKTSVDDAITVGSVIVLRNHDVASLIDDGAKNSIRYWVEKTEDFLPADIVRLSFKLDWLRDKAAGRLAELTAEQMSKANPKMPEEMLQRAAELYCEARSWDRANELANLVAIPFSGSYLEKHIRYIFDQAQNGDADLTGSHGFGEFIKMLYAENSLSKSEIDDLLDEFSLERFKI